MPIEYMFCIIGTKHDSVCKSVSEINTMLITFQMPLVYHAFLKVLHLILYNHCTF